MSVKQAGLIINLLALSNDPEVADARYRLTCKYIQAGYPDTWIDNTTYRPKLSQISKDLTVK